MKLILSFATEDFVTPEHDDVLLRLSTLLTRRGIPGSFHLTGDLARTLRRRRRTDVLHALARHEIGYHSNTHGAFPFLAGLCESRAWDEAVAEIMATEARGLLDLADLFDRRPAPAPLKDAGPEHWDAPAHPAARPTRFPVSRRGRR